MSNLLRRSAGFAGILISGLMVLTSCGGAAPTAVPTKAPVATTAATKAPVATAVPAATATTVPTVAAVASPGNSSGAAVGATVQGKYPVYTAADVKKGGTLRRSLGGDPQCFNPYCASTGNGPPQFLITHQKLIRYQSIQYPEYSVWGSGVFKGSIAETWDITNGGKTFTLHLRHNDMWPALTAVPGEKGPINLASREITSADIKYSFERMKSDPLSLVKSFYAPVVDTQYPDAYTVVVTTDAAYADWIGTSFANGETQFMIRQDYVEAMGSKYGLGFESEYGSGPFSPSTYATGSSYKFVKNPTYYLQPWPVLDAVQDTVIKDSATSQAAYLAGQLDRLGGNRDDVKRFQSQSKDIVIWRGEALSHNPAGMQWNVETGPGATLAIRQAVLKLNNMPRIVSDLQFGEGAYTGCIPAGYVNLSPTQDELKKLYPYDPAGAKKILTDAGFTKEKPAAFDTIYDPAGTAVNDQVNLLRAEVDGMGGIITMNLKTTPAPQARTLALAGSFQSYWAPVSSGTPTKIMNSFYGGTDGKGPPGGQNWMRIRDPKVDAWYQQQSVEFDLAKRAKIMLDFAAYCAQQAWIIPQPTPPTWTSHHGWIKNDGFRDFYLDEDITSWVWIDRTGF